MCESDNEVQVMEHKLITDVTTHKKRKCGILYISTLPPHMNVTKVREIFSLYGDIGRIFLQPAETGQEGKKKKRKPAKHFTEGWVEFQSKRIAKQVALQLNNTRIGERKKSKFYDYLWNIKYLPRFKWVHLNERLAYERAVHQQRLRTEISQAKREANFISHNTEKSEKLRKRRDKFQDLERESKINSFLTQYHQRKTDKEIYHDKEQKSEIMLGSGVEDRSQFLKNLFGSDM
ncbi:activator of basal transcription 1-like isoform X2 [Zootermopsis nevadensis]|uniref:Activator of basal transcription 1 n=1 Tax=Zootermopsis nevadensis TaxID=136037 RepID=A0A067QRK0_ZOONE|nr:activator of basal transcription 1-like isoform X2 [Zootermopsis nevadensis]KDQ71485.1 Activator of basal transcription 1 [Zootermopsis nevadensis]